MKKSNKGSSVVSRVFGSGLVVAVAAFGIHFWLVEGRAPILPSVPQVPPVMGGKKGPAYPPHSNEDSSTNSSRPQPQTGQHLEASKAPGGSKESHLPSATSEESKARWLQFAEKFGSELEPEFDASGRLISIRGMPGRGAVGAEDFKPQDPQKVALRGLEIVSAAHDLLGVSPELPLSPPIPRSGPVTAQLYFRETYRGLNLLPEGNLKIDLGPKGEILGLYSDYLSKLKVNSDVKLSSQDAFAKAMISIDRSAIAQTSTSGVTQILPNEGNKVVWVTRDTQGHVAYQFFIRGHEIVIDALTGEVLSSRNRKQE